MVRVGVEERLSVMRTRFIPREAGAKERAPAAVPVPTDGELQVAYGGGGDALQLRRLQFSSARRR